MGCWVTRVMDLARRLPAPGLFGCREFLQADGVCGE